MIRYQTDGICWLDLSGVSVGVVAGVCVAGAVLLVVAVGLYIFVYRRKKAKALLIPSLLEENSMMQGRGNSFYDSPSAYLCLTMQVKFKIEL